MGRCFFETNVQDVAVLHTLINIDDGMKALTWFLMQHTSIVNELSTLYCTRGILMTFADLVRLFHWPMQILCKVPGQKANVNIYLEWQSTQFVTDAIDPAKIFQNQLRLHRVNFLDLDVQTVSGFHEFIFRIYREPGNTYVYLPYWSYNVHDTVFQVKAGPR